MVVMDRKQYDIEMTAMPRCVVIGNGPINDDTFIRQSIHEDDFILACDGGLHHARRWGITPHWVVGDFDSSPVPDSSMTAEVTVLPSAKDDTDTEHAVREAIRRGFRDFLLVGMLGRRWDHSLGNIYLLRYLHMQGCHQARILDGQTMMEMVGRDPVSIPDTVRYFSLLAIDGDAFGVTIRDAKYPLEDARISCDRQYGISNEVCPGKTATVRVEKGCLLLIRTW